MDCLQPDHSYKSQMHRFLHLSLHIVVVMRVSKAKQALGIYRLANKVETIITNHWQTDCERKKKRKKERIYNKWSHSLFVTMFAICMAMSIRAEDQELMAATGAHTAVLVAYFYYLLYYPFFHMILAMLLVHFPRLN